MHLNTPIEPRPEGQRADELDALRAFRAADTELSPEAEHARLLRGIARLERELDARGRAAAAAPQSRPARRRAPAFVLGGVAAAAAIGISIGMIGPLAAAPEASTVELLELASERAQELSMEAGAGQFLRIEEEWLNLATIPASSDGAAGETLQYRDGETIVTYVPQDQGGDWTVRRSGRAFVEMITPAGDAEAERWAREAAADEQLQGPVGEATWPVGEAPPTSDDLTNPDLAQAQESAVARYRDAPTEPTALLDYIIAEVGPQEGSSNEVVYEWLFPVLQNASYPADLRAAGFELLAQLAADGGADGTVELREGEGTTVTLTLNDESAQELVFSERGDLIESRQVLTAPSEWLAGVAPGTVLTSVRIDTSVVDAVPQAD